MTIPSSDGTIRSRGYFRRVSPQWKNPAPGLVGKCRTIHQIKEGQPAARSDATYGFPCGSGECAKWRSGTGTDSRGSSRFLVPAPEAILGMDEKQREDIFPRGILTLSSFVFALLLQYCLHRRWRSWQAHNSVRCCLRRHCTRPAANSNANLWFADFFGPSVISLFHHIDRKRKQADFGGEATARAIRLARLPRGSRSDPLRIHYELIRSPAPVATRCLCSKWGLKVAGLLRSPPAG